MKAVRVHEFGGPDVLRFEDVGDVEPNEDEAVVSLQAIGVNFVDIYHRTGLYPGDPPFIPGSEGAGTVTAVGTGVTDVGVGDRVAYAMARGSYAESQAVASWRLVRVPDRMDSRSAAALMLQGMTAHYLCTSTFPVNQTHRALVHAAAGGVGLLLVQMLKKLGATVYGTVSTEEKASLAREAGADEVILYSRTDFLSEVRRLTGGRGLDVVYDSVGQATFQGSLDSLAPRGYLVSYGQSSGPVAPFAPSLLAEKGSLFFTRPTLIHYAASREEIQKRASDLFAWHASGDLKIRIGHTFPLSEAAEAHRQLEGRKTTGKVLLLP
jgi:NADPH2:quinone reductase